MKGMELPINAIIVIVIVLIVLTTGLAFFFNAFDPSSVGSSLQSATSSTCIKINPDFCKNKDPERTIASRMAVQDFDANNNGVVNEHVPNGQYSTSIGDDNLDELCSNFYSCSQASADWGAWYNCCLKKVCGCP
ncbi:MAG: hypothetical protein ABIE55_04415 [Candidatus Aenigmatarchaeota archaeon]